MTKEEIRDHGALRAYARLCLGLHAFENGEPNDVDRCVNEVYRGDWNRFEYEAIRFIVGDPDNGIPRG